MIRRLTFWFSHKPFMYFRKTGNGLAVESYNPVTDTLRVRTSRHGYVTGYTTMDRTKYLSLKPDGESV